MSKTIICSFCGYVINYFKEIDGERGECFEEHYINASRGLIICKKCCEKLYKQETTTTPKRTGN